MEYYSALKREEILTYAITWMNLEDITLSEINHSQKEKYYMILLIWGAYMSTYMVVARGWRERNYYLLGREDWKDSGDEW